MGAIERAAATIRAVDNLSDNIKPELLREMDRVEPELLIPLKEIVAREAIPCLKRLRTP